MKLSVIVPLHGFNPNREEALSMLLRAVEAQDLRVVDANGNPTDEKDFEVIIAEQATPDGRHHDLPSRPHLKHLKLPVYAPGFCKSWVMNAAAREAKCKSLVFLDVDMLFGKDFFAKISLFHDHSKSHFFICWRNIVFLPGKDEPIPRVIDNMIFTAGGAFFVDRVFYWNVGGMHENYIGYGGEDNDFWVRANQAIGNKNSINVPAMNYALCHWYHDWATPSPARFDILNRTVQNPGRVIEKLKRASLGNPTSPVLVYLNDIPLVGSGLEKKDGKGLV